MLLSRYVSARWNTFDWMISRYWMFQWSDSEENYLLCFYQHVFINQWSIMILSNTIASYCRHDLPIRTNILSGIPAIHWGYPIGRNQYLVLDCPTVGISDECPTRLSLDMYHRIGILLCYVDCDPMLCLPIVFENILGSLGDGSKSKWDILPSWNDLHPSPRCIVFIEHQMDVRSIQPHH
jgi:hypothetical protein